MATIETEKSSETDTFVTKEPAIAEGPCGLCMDLKGNGELDLTCDKCKFYVCFECMFEYMKFNRNKETLLCPHCRQDLFNLDDKQDVSDTTFSYMEIMESLKKWMI